MKVCDICGWEIKNWWQGGGMCDDCALDTMIEHNKDERIMK